MTEVRRCTAPIRLRQSEDDPDLILHPGIPPELAQPFCPMRAPRLPGVEPWLRLFARYRRYGVLPTAGGLEDQEERTLQIFDRLTWALGLPPRGDEA